MITKSPDLFGQGIQSNFTSSIDQLPRALARWINKHNLYKRKFEWQDEYFAVSVSESMIDKVREYIKNQEDHHKKKTFQQEYNQFSLTYLPSPNC